MEEWSIILNTTINTTEGHNQINNSTLSTVTF